MTPRTPNICSPLLLAALHLLLVTLGWRTSCRAELTLRVRENSRIRDSSDLQIEEKTGYLDRSNRSYCGQLCLTVSECAASSVGRPTIYSSRYLCYLYRTGYKLDHGELMAGWDTYIKLKDGSPLLPAPTPYYQKTVYIRHAGVLLAYKQGEGEAPPDSRRVSWALVGAVLVSTGCLGLCAAISRPRRMRTVEKMAKYGYDPQQQQT